MVTICQQCGDKGWSVALIYCSRCIDFAVHRYCLPIIPPTFDEFVSWACEDCERRKTLKDRSLNHVDPVDCETKMNTKHEDMCLEAEKIEEIAEKVQDFSSPWQFPDAPATQIEPEVKIMTDAVDSETNMDENKTSQTPNSAKKMRKKRRKTVTCGTRKRKKIVKPLVEKQEEPAQVDPTEHAEPAKITSENKTSQTPNSTKKMRKRRKTVTCGTRKKRKTVNLTAKKQEEPEEMDLAEHAQPAKITNDAIENKTSQTPNSTKNMRKRRKTATCGTRKRRKAVNLTAKKQEEPEEMNPAEHAQPAKITNDAIENKTSQTPNSTKKMWKRRKTVTCGTRKRRKAVNLTANKQEPEEMDPTEHAEPAKITNDAIENKTSQTPNSATKKPKRKRRTVTCGTRKRRKAVLMTKP